jgi:hypothetical protein
LLFAVCRFAKDWASKTAPERIANDAAGSRNPKPKTNAPISAAGCVALPVPLQGVNK